MAQTKYRLKIILASASPRRRFLLKKAGLSFRVCPSGVSEASHEKNPIALVRLLALRKAEAVARKIHLGVVLGADTLVVHKNKILGKPAGKREAYQMLYSLSGSTHRVYTGVALVDAATRKRRVGHAVSVVKMRKLTREELLRLSRKNLDKAGSYAIQERNDSIARVVKGTYDNVVGLPVRTVKELLKKLSRDVEYLP